MTGIPLEEARSGWDEKVTLGNDVTLTIEGNRKLRQRTRGRAEDNLCRITEVES
jgi:hypothetical protein